MCFYLKVYMCVSIWAYTTIQPLLTLNDICWRKHTVLVGFVQVLIYFRKEFINKVNHINSGIDFSLEYKMRRLLRCLNRTDEVLVKQFSLGGTRSWTMDLSICSRMLYHWAIPPLMIVNIYIRFCVNEICIKWCLRQQQMWYFPITWYCLQFLIDRKVRVDL